MKTATRFYTPSNVMVIYVNCIGRHCCEVIRQLEGVNVDVDLF
jgi:hypothetical protein